jgi:hypothetical protein
MILICGVGIWASTSWAGPTARQPSAVSIWKQELEAFKNRNFLNLEEVKKSATEFQNKLMDDQELRFEEKVTLRNQMYQLENQKSAQFPEPRIVGFKKVPVDPSNPGRGYTLEPEFK